MDNKRYYSANAAVDCTERVRVAQSNDNQSVTKRVYTNNQNTFQHSKLFQPQSKGHRVMCILQGDGGQIL
jgi:hypothetical protein